MNVYLIQDEHSERWHKRGPHGGTWVDQRQATLYLSRLGALPTIETIKLWWAGSPDTSPVVREFDPFAATRILRDLYEIRDLGDYTYDVREREGLDWNGPLVTKWSEACAEAERLLK